jgi:hypothetical protein
VIPQVGVLPPDDRRVRGTVDAIARDLVVDGLVLRYSTVTDVDGCRHLLHMPADVAKRATDRGERPVAVAQAT